MRTLTAEQIAALDQTVTRPGVLVEFALEESFLRLSSRGTVYALGVSWTWWDIEAQGIGMDQGRPGTTGSLAIGDPAFEISAALLNEAVGLPVAVYRFTEEALAADSDDVVQVFAGVMGEVSGGSGNGKLVVSLIAKESTVFFTPRRTVSSASGFMSIVANRIFTFNDAKYELTRER